MSRWQSWAWTTWPPWPGRCDCLGRCGRGLRYEVRQLPSTGLPCNMTGTASRLARPATHEPHPLVSTQPVAWPQRVQSPHTRPRPSAASTHLSTKDPAGRHHKPRRHKRAARARNAAIGTGRIQPRGIDGATSNANACETLSCIGGSSPSGSRYREVPGCPTLPCRIA